MSIWNGKYVSVNSIIEKAYRDMGLGEAINFSDAVEWAGEAVDFIGSPMQLKEKVEEFTIENYRGQLPCDVHLINTAHASATQEGGDNRLFPMRYSTDAMHHHYCDRNNDTDCDTDLTYKVNDDFMFTNFACGSVRLSYKAIPTDECGFPLIPDDVKFKNAVAYHIMWKIAFIKFIRDEIKPVAYQKIESDRDWYIGAAQTRGNTPSMDLMESIKNNWIRLIPKINHHTTGFKELGHREERFTKNSHVIGRGTSQLDERQRSDRTFFFFKDNGTCNSCTCEAGTCNCGCPDCD